MTMKIQRKKRTVSRKRMGQAHQNVGPRDIGETSLPKPRTRYY